MRSRYNKAETINNDETVKKSKKTQQTSAGTESNGPETKNGIVINSPFVNLRTSPSLDSRVIGMLRRGDKVEILQKGSKFYKVVDDKQHEGYVASPYIMED